MKNKNILYKMMLLSAALIWGVAFVAQSVGADSLGAFTINGIRCMIGAVVLLPYIYIRDKRTKPVCGWNNKDLWIGGVLCGIILCIATNAQQFGIEGTDAGKAGFITAMYIVLVPVLSLIIGKKTTFIVWISVIFAVIGLYLLCVKEGFSINISDLYVLLCAFIFAIHILVIDFYSPKVDGVKMSCIQFGVAGIISCILMFVFETPNLSVILSSWLPILYLGIMSSGIAYTLQIVGQSKVQSASASILLSLESVFSVIAGWLILGQTLTLKECVGCFMMFCAVMLVVVPIPLHSNKKLNVSKDKIDRVM